MRLFNTQTAILMLCNSLMLSLSTQSWMAHPNPSLAPEKKEKNEWKVNSLLLGI